MHSNSAPKKRRIKIYQQRNIDNQRYLLLRFKGNEQKFLVKETQIQQKFKWEIQEYDRKMSNQRQSFQQSQKKQIYQDKNKKQKGQINLNISQTQKQYDNECKIISCFQSKNTNQIMFQVRNKDGSYVFYNTDELQNKDPLKIINFYQKKIDYSNFEKLN